MDLIRSEGIDIVSARNVADRAGYSYATLYNYFKDIRDLIFSCVETFMNECREFVEENTLKDKARNSLAAVSLAYAKYFVQYPGVFDLLYEQKLTNMSTKKSDIESIDGLFNSLTQKAWAEVGLQEEQMKQAAETHNLALHGLLMLYLNRRKNISFRQLSEKIAELSENYSKTV